MLLNVDSDKPARGDVRGDRGDKGGEACGGGDGMASTVAVADGGFKGGARLKVRV